MAKQRQPQGAPMTPGNSRKNATSRSSMVDLSFLTFRELVDSTGRRDVRIFGLPREQLIMVAVAVALFGVPLMIIIAMVPVWDLVGEFAILKQFNSYAAPAVEGFSYNYRAPGAPQFPIKRSLIASVSIVELLFLSNFVALFARGVRNHALLVWTCYDREKLLQYFAISCVVFFGLWYVLFFDWQILSVVGSGSRGVRLIVYAVMSMPFVTLVFGHLTTIVALGACRSGSRTLRRLRGKR
jgi:hypothetical protein